MRHLKVILLVAAIVTFLVAGTTYALWSQEAKVVFTLTITPPPSDEYTCGTYDTIQEGLDLLKGEKYYFIDSRFDSFASMLWARVAELNNLPLGGITQADLLQELQGYRDEVNDKFGGYIHKYGQGINKLSNFYNKASKEEKGEVPDFWDQQSHLWDLHSHLWDKHSALYDIITEVQEAGNAKI